MVVAATESATPRTTISTKTSITNPQVKLTLTRKSKNDMPLWMSVLGLCLWFMLGFGALAVLAFAHWSRHH
jgi:hypothetical protein